MSALTSAGQALQQAIKQRELAMATVKREILAAHNKGLPITVIARQAGVSRPTVYAILKELGKK